LCNGLNPSTGTTGIAESADLKTSDQTSSTEAPKHDKSAHVPGQDVSTIITMHPPEFASKLEELRNVVNEVDVRVKHLELNAVKEMSPLIS
jgi:hypothetical protein